MDFTSFIKKLENRLEAPLPGERAQFMMAPPSRKKYAELIADSAINPRLSAVLILIFPDQHLLKTILIKRPLYEGVHSGQIAFPGGKFENDDVDLVNTALRETKEELGVEVHPDNVLGALSDVYIYPSNFLVKPFVAFLDKRPHLMIDPREVEQSIETNLLALNDVSIIKETTINYTKELQVQTPYYDVEGFNVWGATAMMISELNVVINTL